MFGRSASFNKPSSRPKTGAPARSRKLSSGLPIPRVATAGRSNSSIAGGGSNNHNARLVSMMNVLSGCQSGVGDKTICKYCGVSYVSSSEMKSLQATVKDQEERLNHYKQMMEENNRLKEAVESSKKAHTNEIRRIHEDYRNKQSSATLGQLEELKRQLKQSQAMNISLAQKYTLASDDFRLQEEVISSLRDQLRGLYDSQVENSSLKKKISSSSLDDTIRNFLSMTKSSQIAEYKGMFGDSMVNNANNTIPEIDAKEVDVAQPTSDSSPEGQIIGECVTVVAGVRRSRIAARSRFKISKTTNSGKSQTTGATSLTAIEVQDLMKLNSVLNDKVRTLAQEHSTCNDLHSFLRETVDKLKSDNKNLHENMNGLKIKFEEAVIELENLEVQLHRLQGENSRLKLAAVDQATKLCSAVEENKALKLKNDPKTIQELEAKLKVLQRELVEKEHEIEALKLSYDEQLATANANLNMEKERADSCVRAIIAEREEVERRWEERWARHQSSLNNQLESLKGSYEKSAATAKELEEVLQKDLREVHRHLDVSKDQWEAAKAELETEIEKWKSMHETKSTELESIQKAKIQVELILQNKNLELDSLHEMIRDGCEERQALQGKIEELERTVDEVKQNLLFQRRKMFMNTSLGYCTNNNSGMASSGTEISLSPIGATPSSSLVSCTSPAPGSPGILKSSLKPSSGGNIVKEEPMAFTVSKPRKVTFAQSSESKPKSSTSSAGNKCMRAGQQRNFKF